nr:hypothetical protein [Actinomycetota bacterium]
GQKPGVTTADAQRIKTLEQENKELKRANEILRRASAFMPMARLCRKRWVAVAVGAGQTGWGGLAVSA